MTLRARSGGSAGQIWSIRVSTGTSWFARRTRWARTARCLGPPRRMVSPPTSTSRGPRIRNSVMPWAPPPTAARVRAPLPRRDAAWSIRQEREAAPCEPVSTRGPAKARAGAGSVRWSRAPASRERLEEGLKRLPAVLKPPPPTSRRWFPVSTDRRESEGDEMSRMHVPRPTNEPRPRGRRQRKARGAALTAIVGLVSVAAVACSSGKADRPAGEQQRTTGSSPVAPSDSSPTQKVRDIMKLPDFAPLEPGRYFIDPDQDRSTPLRVVYDVPSEGWSQWFGAVKSAADEIGHVAVSIITVTNVVRHGCRDHSPADPPVGPTVDDLATALANLAPFRMTSPPSDVTIYGYRGKHLELTVPDLPVEGDPADLRFVGCVDGDLYSWISRLNDGPFYGSRAPATGRSS